MNPPPGITVLPNNQWVITDDTHLSLWAQQKGTIVTDPNLFRFLHPYLTDISTIWDVGANIGDHARQYLDWGKQVVAIEPNPLAFLCLSHNCPEAILVNAAASNSAGEHLRFMRLDNAGASRIHPNGDILVPTVILDWENLPTPGLIKLDVEGWELFALCGMQETIEKHRPLVFCEINRGALAANDITPDMLTSWFAERDYYTDVHYPAKALPTDEQFDILFIPKHDKA